MADSLTRWSMGNSDGEEDFEAASVDEGGCSYAEDACPKTKTTVIARKLKRSLGATHQKAMRLGVMLGGGRRSKGE
jgi:hypothetical protein